MSKRKPPVTVNVPADVALLMRLRDALNEQFHEKPGRLGKRHLRDCRLAPRFAMSDGFESPSCVLARDALEDATVRIDELLERQQPLDLFS